MHDVGRLFRRSLRPRVSASHAEPVRGAGSAAGLREEDEEDAGGGEDDAVHLHLPGGGGGDEGPRGGDLGGNLVGILSPEVTRGRTPGVEDGAVVRPRRVLVDAVPLREGVHEAPTRTCRGVAQRVAAFGTRDGGAQQPDGVGMLVLDRARRAVDPIVVRRDSRDGGWIHAGPSARLQLVVHAQTRDVVGFGRHGERSSATWSGPPRSTPSGGTDC